MSDTDFYVLRGRPNILCSCMVDLLFKLLPVLLAQLLFFCSYVFTFFQSLIVELNFCDSGEAWDIKVFLQKRGR